MAKLEELSAGASVRGVAGDAIATIVNVNWHGSNCIDVVYKTADGRVANDILYRDDESRIEIVQPGRVWSFEGDGDLFRLASEAYRIHLAHLFDPHLAIHTSEVDPLPHQITAVYGEMLPRQPLRFLLADDPGAVGFALTILQRRLASSPEAIYQSLRRRKERLESRLREERLLKRGEELSAFMHPISCGYPRSLGSPNEPTDSSHEAFLEAREDEASRCAASP